MLGFRVLHEELLRYTECEYFLFDVQIHKTHPMKMNKCFGKDLAHIHSSVHGSGSSLKASRSSLLQGMY